MKKVVEAVVLVLVVAACFKVGDVAGRSCSAFLARYDAPPNRLQVAGEASGAPTVGDSAPAEPLPMPQAEEALDELREQYSARLGSLYAALLSGYYDGIVANANAAEEVRYQAGVRGLELSDRRGEYFQGAYEHKAKYCLLFAAIPTESGRLEVRSRLAELRRIQDIAQGLGVEVPE